MGRDAITSVPLITAAAPVARVSPYLLHDLLLKIQDGQELLLLCTLYEDLEHLALEGRMSQLQHIHIGCQAI
jgi:hypothetical protein